MCYVQNCSKGNELGSYFVTGACTVHFHYLKVYLAARFADLKSNADLCNDVALAYVLMSDEAAALALLDSFNNWLSSIDPDRVRLSAGPGILGAGLLVPARADPAGGGAVVRRLPQFDCAWLRAQGRRRRGAAWAAHAPPAMARPDGGDDGAVQGSRRRALEDVAAEALLLPGRGRALPRGQVQCGAPSSTWAAQCRVRTSVPRTVCTPRS